MKSIVLLLTIVTAFSSYSYQCEHFFSDENKVETLEYIAVEQMRYSSTQEFCDKHNYLDLELNFMPNYFKLGEEDDDHYKMMIHRAYSSCTYIYNITKKFVTDKSCYSTW